MNGSPQLLQAARFTRSNQKAMCVARHTSSLSTNSFPRFCCFLLSVVGINSLSFFLLFQLQPVDIIIIVQASLAVSLLIPQFQLLLFQSKSRPSRTLAGRLTQTTA
ncbi:uncharacterized protein AKAW2_20999S [Aspergillus luchuensis]|uniref:Uncharacterized protein n=1 Tax=Aspergillus kawachii TaxID=1069201 RepID=A0A7R7W482_ASPKA|nr:uncharacterized protein AKAW2_20999S [Aspergillus luchuensis]BCR96059.1 hypothetical protein AKAW2_20999S [Aspergillus luchuensis]